MKDNFQNIYNKEYFDGPNSQYNGGYKSNNTELQRRLDLFNKFDFDSFLDIGCGNGYLVQGLKVIGKEANGFDISEYIIKRDGIDNICIGDVLKFPYKEKYDLIFSADLMEHLDINRIDKCCEQCKEQANKHIIHIISTSYEKEIGDGSKLEGMDNGHISMYTQNWWINKFKQHFEGWNIQLRFGLFYIILGGEKFNTTIFMLSKDEIR